MHRAARIVVSGLLFALFSSAVGQSQVLVTGTVLNEATGLPIPGLSVYLIDAEGEYLPDIEDEEAEDEEESAENITDLEGRFAVLEVAPDAWYGIEVYAGGTLLFADYVFIDGTTAFFDEEGFAIVELAQPISLMLQRN